MNQLACFLGVMKIMLNQFHMKMSSTLMNELIPPENVEYLDDEPVRDATCDESAFDNEYETVMAVGFSKDFVPNPTLVAKDDPIKQGAKRARAEFGSSALECDSNMSTAHLHDELMGRDKEPDEEDRSCRETVMLDVEPEVAALLPEDSADDHQLRGPRLLECHLGGVVEVLLDTLLQGR
ncbi:hypothetical protein Q3G72_007187 [Acer saccharum]|nr:hypothetical protein Q3G72_007187 [Acer saccharum]